MYALCGFGLKIGINRKQAEGQKVFHTWSPVPGLPVLYDDFLGHK